MWIFLGLGVAALLVLGVLVWRLVAVIGETRKLMVALKGLQEKALPETQALLDQGLALGEKAEGLLTRRNGEQQDEGPGSGG